MQGSVATNEREKLENTINEEVQSQISYYQGIRREDRQLLLNLIQDEPNKERRAILNKFTKVKDDLIRIGYMFRHGCDREYDVWPVLNWDRVNSVREFDQTTRDTIDKLQTIRRRILMKLYTATGTDELLTELITEMQKVIQGTARRTRQTRRQIFSV